MHEMISVRSGFNESNGVIRLLLKNKESVQDGFSLWRIFELCDRVL